MKNKIKSKIKVPLEERHRKEIFSRLKRIEENVSLSTFDNTLLVLMIFLFSIGLSLLSLGIPTIFKENPVLLSGLIFFFILLIPLATGIWMYSQSIFFKKNSFNTRIGVLTYLFFSLNFIVLNWLFLGISFIYEQFYLIPKNTVYFVELGIIIVSILIVRTSSKKISNYFFEEYPETIKKRKKELKIK